MYTKFALNMIEFKLWILSNIWLLDVNIKIYEMMNTRLKKKTYSRIVKEENDPQVFLVL
jgi:hypothetical protein